MEMEKKMMLGTILLCVIVLPLVVAEDKTRHFNGWKNIKKMQNHKVEEVAKYAVAEHNKLYKTQLKLSHVVSGRKQHVALGINNYKLVISTTDSKKYEVIVLVRRHSFHHNSKKLASFTPLA